MSDELSKLIKYNEVRAALAIVASVDEVKDIMNEAERMKLYAKQAKDTQMEKNAVDIRMRAIRELGFLMKKQEETIGLNKGGRPVSQKQNVEITGSVADPVAKNRKATYTEASIDKHLADKARIYRKDNEEEFEDRIKTEQSKIDNRSTIDITPKQSKKKLPDIFYFAHNIFEELQKEDGFIDKLDELIKHQDYLSIDIQEGIIINLENLINHFTEYIKIMKQNIKEGKKDNPHKL